MLFLYAIVELTTTFPIRNLNYIFDQEFIHDQSREFVRNSPAEVMRFYPAR